ncbi:hypothetical protein C8R44DRAFT_734597 [Mycena epipterygia]|nr:hypothetical protein C8R44DRAFT_734597 [Mycena epipterygia]
MNLLSIIALCLVSSASASADSKRTPDAVLHARDDPSQTISLALPSPTSTSSAVVAAYSTYSQKCGAVLNTAAQAALKTYENVTDTSGVSITDPKFTSWASTQFPAYMQATQDCQNAQLDYQDALASAGSGPSSSAAAGPSAPAPAPSSATPSAAGPSSATPSAQPSSSPPPASAPPSDPSSSPQPSPSKPASAVFHGPSWALALAGLVAAFYLS